DECARRGVSVLAAAPYNSGLLAHDWPPDGANFDYGPAPADVLARARSLAEIAQQRGASLPQLAMQFPLQHAATAAVVVGMRTADQVTSSAARLAAPLPDDVWDDVESLGRPDAGP
ncbi:MAG: D-threo-aldose 1-dehydrogenase, partial [Pseudonocardiales bacterium]|nr:D-threo-aldose 1-dehydrogenase [Pseudonocardiales bacterium]